MSRKYDSKFNFGLFPQGYLEQGPKDFFTSSEKNLINSTRQWLKILQEKSFEQSALSFIYKDLLTNFIPELTKIKDNPKLNSHLRDAVQKLIDEVHLAVPDSFEIDNKKKSKK